MHGQGTYFYFKEGDKYTGEWKDNLKNGQGTYTWSNANKYTGEWQNNNSNV